MKKLIIALLVGIFAFCLTFGLGTTAFAESATEISTADELLAIDGTTGNYILRAYLNSTVHSTAMATQ